MLGYPAAAAWTSSDVPRKPYSIRRFWEFLSGDGTIAEEFWISGLPHFVVLTPDRRLSWDILGTGVWTADSVTVRLSEMLER